MSSNNKVVKKLTACGGVVWKIFDGKLHVLLVKQFAHKNQWGIPKGHLNKQESFEECAIREIREECGIDVVLGQRLPTITTTYKNEIKSIYAWLAQPVGNDIPCPDHPESEVADARWFCIDELPTIQQYQQNFLFSAIKSLASSLKNQ